MSDKLSSIGPDELADAKRDLKTLGFEPAEFDFRDRPDKSPARDAPVTGELVVFRAENSAAKVYTTGFGSDWPMRFRRDLEMGAFGPPKLK